MQFNQQDPTQIQESDFTDTKINGDLRAFMYFVKISFEHKNISKLFISNDYTFGGGFDGPINKESDAVFDYETYCKFLINRFSKPCNKRIFLMCTDKNHKAIGVELTFVLPKAKEKIKRKRCNIL